MMGHRDKLKSVGEWDLTTNWRHVLCSFKRAGTARFYKKSINRRARRGVKLRLLNPDFANAD